MERHETDWRTILLLVGAAGGAVIAYGIAALMVLYAGLDTLYPSSTVAADRSPFDYFVLAAAPVVIGTILVPAVYYSVRRMLGRPATGKPVPIGMPRGFRAVFIGRTSVSAPVAWSVLSALIVAPIWVGVAFLTGRLVANSVLKWATPVLYVLAILIPAGFFLWIAIRGINPGSPQRRWGALAAGIGLGIIPAMAAEMFLVLGIVLIVVFWLAFNPSQLATVENLARQLQDSSNMNQIINTVGPMLNNPLVILGALLFFSVLSPLIEETTKSLAVWSVFDRLSSPAQGFAIGAISGTAFGLVESLLVSAQPDTGWTTTLLVRGASTMMHIMSASLTGWGIGQFRATRRFLPLLGMYLLAMALHGTWNGSVVAITAGSVRSAAASGGRDLLGMLLIYVGTAMLLVLCLAIPVALWTINWRLRASSAGGTGGPEPLIPSHIDPSPASPRTEPPPSATTGNTPSSPPPLP